MTLANVPVEVTLGGDTVTTYESYSAGAAILSQPSHLSLRMGSGSTVAQIKKRYPAGTPYEWKVGGKQQASGYVTGHSIESTASASEITVLGADALHPLTATDVGREISFSNVTYFELTQAALEACGLDPSKLITDGVSDATARSGVRQANAVPIHTSHGKYVSGGGTTTVSTVQTRVEETWMQFVRRHIDRIGLMLWASAAGEFILSAPSPLASPSYRIVRRRGGSPSVVNVTRAAWIDDTSRRHSIYEIFGRVGSTKFCRAQAKGAYVDDELFNLGGQFEKRTRTFRDAHVASIEQAEFLAARKAAEERREGWQLHYTVAGHVTPAIQGGAFAVWTPNTVVDVQDDEYDLHGPHWIESCEYRRAPHTETLLRLMRVQDVTFGDQGEAETE